MAGKVWPNCSLYFLFFAYMLFSFCTSCTRILYFVCIYLLSVCLSFGFLFLLWHFFFLVVDKWIKKIGVLSFSIAIQMTKRWFVLHRITYWARISHISTIAEYISSYLLYIVCACIVCVCVVYVFFFLLSFVIYFQRVCGFGLKLLFLQNTYSIFLLNIMKQTIQCTRFSPTYSNARIYWK